MKVKDTYEKAILGAGIDDSMQDAASRMYAHGVGSLAIFRGPDIVGIITERDVLQAVAENADLAGTRILDYMTSGVVTVTPGYDVGQAAGLMVRLGARHLPVVDDNGLMLGMLSARDLMSIVGEVPLPSDPEARASDATATREEVVVDAGRIAALPFVALDGNEGVTVKTLWHDPRDDSNAGLMKLDPGASVAPHTHRYSVHHVWIAQGTCVVRGETLGVGSYCFVPAGVEHAIDKAGDDGCTLFYLHQRVSSD